MLNMVQGRSSCRLTLMTYPFTGVPIILDFLILVYFSFNVKQTLFAYVSHDRIRS